MMKNKFVGFFICGLPSNWRNLEKIMIKKWVKLEQLL